MNDIERIERRLSAVERAVIDGELELTALDDVASLAETLETLTERIDAHERRIASWKRPTSVFSSYANSVRRFSSGW